ncbi:MAG: beta strand repeat-containing protein [Planctomycetota bacterium]
MPLKVVPRVPTKPVRNIYKGMESLESRALMAANVLTDLPDYLPGETAIISAWNDSESGADFTAGETVLFQVTRTDGLNDLPNGNLPWFVTDGVGGFDGYFVDSDNDGSNDYGVFPDTDGTVNAALGTTWFVEEQYFKSTLLLTATGQSSSAVATWEFTDGGSFSVSPGDDTLSVNVAAGSNANLANVTLTVPKNNGLQTPTIAFSGAPTGVTITYSALSDSDAANAVGTVNTGGSRDNDQTIVYRINLASTTSVSPGTYPIRATFAASTGTINTPNNQWDFNLVILAADGSGSLGVGTQSGTATYGGTTENVTFAIDATRQSNGNFSGTYSVSGLPTGVTGSFNPTSFTSTGSNAFNDSVLTLTVPSTVSAGSYPFTVILTNTNNSTFVQSFGTLLVQRAGLTIAANNLTKTYGDTLTLDDTTPGDFAVTGLSNSDTVTSVILTSSGTDATANVGSYSIVPSAAIGSGLSNYDITYTDGSLSVQKRSVTISADAKSKTYADGNPTLTATEGNTVAGAAALDYSLATTAGQFSDVGSYEITVSLGRNPNYSVTTTDGSLTVGQRSVSVTADDQSKTYGDANPTFTATEGNTVAGAATLQYTLATTASQFSNVGSYPISITLGSNPNYSVTTTDGSLTINQRSVTITADAQSKTYGDADPSLTYAVTSGSVVNGDSFSGSLSRATGENVGTYAINQGSVSLGSNYSLSYVGANLTINQRAATIVANAFTRLFGEANPTFTAVVSGTANNDTLNYSLTTVATQFSPVGSYPILVSLGSNPNYSVVTTPSTLTIEERDAVARYIGQTIAVASGSSATSAQVSLAASVQDPTGLGLVGAKVTFIDTLTNRVLASNVPVSPVAGSPYTGTANTFVTLSTGTYGSQLYNVKVIVTGNYTNDAQLSDSSSAITVTKPAGTEMISASGRIAQSSGTAGTYGVTVSGDVTFSVDLKYNKSGKNLQGKVELFLPSSNGSQIYIKSNALNSMVVDGNKVNGTIYVKANATRLNADGTTTTLEGNISLRIDLSEANSGQVAITAMSSTSQLLYSNDWYFEDTIRGWKSRLAAVSSGLIQIN